VQKLRKNLLKLRTVFKKRFNILNMGESASDSGLGLPHKTHSSYIRNLSIQLKLFS